MLVGFHSRLNQAAVRSVIAQLDADRAVRPTVSLISRTNYLQGRADFFLSSQDGYRDCGFEQSRAWPFPPQALLHDLCAAESTALRMMDRVQRVSGAGSTIESRQRRWLEWVTYIYGMLRSQRVDTVLFCNVPHFPFEYALLEVARKCGLKTRFFMQLQVLDTFVSGTAVDALFEPLSGSLVAADRELEPRMQAELERRDSRRPFFYMHKRGVPWGTRLHVWQRRLFRWRPKWVPSAWAYWRARQAAKSYAHDSAPFVYLPLHLQPEATTCPMGGVYVDQLLVVEMVSRALPAGWRLVVKENPKQQLSKRQPTFYQRLAQLPNVQLVSRRHSSMDLIEAAQAVAAITGSAGWEGLCAGKPVLVFGNAFYRAAMGAVAVDDLDTLREELARIADGRFVTATSSTCRAFLAGLQQHSYRGVTDAQYLRDSTMSEDEAIQAYAMALRDMLADSRAVVPESVASTVATIAPALPRRGTSPEWNGAEVHATEAPVLRTSFP